MLDSVAIQAGLQALSDQDPVIKDAVALYGLPEPRVRQPGFRALLNIVGSQQISTHAAAAILGRVHTLMEAQANPDDARAFLLLTDDELRGAGFSKRKVDYARGVASALTEGHLDLSIMTDQSDEEVIKAITALKGFGRWSAEIYCMFCLGRPDIFPADDIALQEALGRLRGLDSRPNAKLSRELMQDYAPYRSVMSLFLWHYYKGIPQ